MYYAKILGRKKGAKEYGIRTSGYCPQESEAARLKFVESFRKKLVLWLTSHGGHDDIILVHGETEPETTPEFWNKLS